MVGPVETEVSVNCIVRGDFPWVVLALNPAAGTVADKDRVSRVTGIVGIFFSVS
jgi:hypothetical protein